MSVNGVNEVQKFFKQYAKDANLQAEMGTKEGAVEILDYSKRLAPRETGRMIKETDIIRSGEDEFKIRYNQDYSLYVHEDLENSHPNGGQAKFLEVATYEKANTVFKKVAEKIGKIK